ncbi:MAG: DUF167 domain-containing protein [Candidatus Chlorobium antarcticum]|nr:DUF167 domain-containing protein [Candidatus Chlorobium antarcticum]
MVVVREKKGNAVFSVRVHPRASKTAVSEPYAGGLKITLKAAPVDDAANRECCRLFADMFGIADGRVHVVSGRSSRNKSVMLDGVSSSEAELALGRLGW